MAQFKVQNVMTIQQTHLTHPKYRLDIDGLRAVAVLSVVAYHAFPGRMPGGLIGVDIFFVISGYLISTIIFENLEHGTFTFVEFYARRIRRIFPALILVMASCFAFGWIALLADEYKQLGKHIAGGAGFISNFILWKEAGYFDNSAATKPLLHLWSLGIEEQFYIIYPLLMWFAWKRNFNALTATIIIASVSFYLNIKGIKADPVAVFYSPLSRVWELLCGSLLAWLALYKQADCFGSRAIRMDAWLGRAIYKRPPKTNGEISANVMSLVGLLFIGFGLLTINNKMDFPGKWAALPTLGTVLIIAAGPKAWPNRQLLSQKVLVWFGLISFPLYLWHWPILAFARIIESDIPTWKMRIASVALSIFLAWGTYKFVEKPIRRGGRVAYKALVLTIIMISLGYIGFNSYTRDGLPFRKVTKQAELVNKEFSGTLWKFAQNEICTDKYPLTGSKDYGWWFCAASKTVDPTVLLLGSSYANDLYPGFASNPSFANHSVLSIGTCDPAWIDESQFIEAKSGFGYSPCVGYRHRDQQTFINGIIRDKKSLRFVIMNGLNIHPDSNYIQRLRRRIDYIESNGIKVIIFLPRVAIDFDEHGRMLVDFDIKGCFARPFASPKFGCAIAMEKIETALKGFAPLVKEISKSNPNVQFFDQTPLFCQKGKCSFIKNEMPLIRDVYGHMSEYGSRELSIVFENWARVNAPAFFVNDRNK